LKTSWWSPNFLTSKKTLRTASTQSKLTRKESTQVVKLLHIYQAFSGLAPSGLLLLSALLTASLLSLVTILENSQCSQSAKLLPTHIFIIFMFKRAVEKMYISTLAKNQAAKFLMPQYLTNLVDLTTQWLMQVPSWFAHY
jgi:hypothetical protein